MATGKAAQVMTGARAKVFIDTQLVGIFNNISYGLTYTADPIFILGAYGPQETVYTAQDAVNITCSGWRVIDHGPHTGAKMPTLTELLNHAYIEITVEDRQSNKTLAAFRSCRPVSYNTTLANRQPAEVQVTFIGLKVDDETSTNSETPGASSLPGAAP